MSSAFRDGGGGGGGSLYTMSSEPRTVVARNKYRDPYDASMKKKGNLMWDPRIYRGSAFASQVIPPSVQEDLARQEREEEIKRRRQERRHMLKLQQEAEARIGTPPPVDGRRHSEIQTEAFLEEIRDRPVEKDIDTQTDALLDRPPSPMFIPKKSGKDRETQIWPGELFDFDSEIDPLLEVIVGKTLEQSLMEVQQEEELENLARHQREYEQLRNAELAETQRLEAAERRRFEEKERRLQQERERVAREEETKKKLSARTFANSFLQNLEAAAFSELDRRGFFFDTVDREVEMSFLPWLYARTEQHLHRKRTAQGIVDAIVVSAIEKLVKQSEQTRDERNRLEEAIELERLEKERLIQEEAERKEQERLEAIQQKELEEARRRELEDAEAEENQDEEGNEDEDED